METGFHSLSDLFAQLGLPSDEDSITQFVQRHRPLPETLHLYEAPFWTPQQARMLEEGLGRDADWAEVVDQLNVALRAR